MAVSTSFLKGLSWLLGWIYVFCWSLSFYPQPIHNFRKHSTKGTTIDFPAINILGFVAYGAANAAFLYSTQIRKEYALRHHGQTPTVRFNDLAFAAHAVLLSIILVSQFFPELWGFEKRGRRELGVRISGAIWVVVLLCFLAVFASIFTVVASQDPDPKTGWAWIDVIYTISYVKIGVTLVKYTPQVYTNYRNQSTQGWSIHQILLDFAGGILSIMQLVIDSYLQGDWSGITGNLTKLALGNISIFFDVIFMTQHYFLYNGREGSDRPSEEDSLIEDASREERIE